MSKVVSANGAFRPRSHKWALSTPFVSKDEVQVREYHISPAMWGVAGTTMGRLGVIAHEAGHFLGM
jgi:hypothetical protein